MGWDLLSNRTRDFEKKSVKNVPIWYSFLLPISCDLGTRLLTVYIVTIDIQNNPIDSNYISAVKFHAIIWIFLF